MTDIKRLWTDEESLGMGETISTLRRMRSAAVMRNPTTPLRVKTAINNFFGGQKQIYSQQDALLAAEELADAAGDFFAAKLSKTTSGKIEFEKWQDLLWDTKNRYTLYGATTYARTSLLETVGISVIGRLRNLDIDPNYALEWDLLENNNLGVESIEQLINQEVGVISPLSGDYLMASAYSSYLQRTMGKSFPTRAAALSRNLSDVVLPVDLDGNFPFTDKPTIGMYIDTTRTGNTGQALWMAVKEAYPQQIVHQPRLEETEFTQSETMVAFWKDGS